MADTRFVPIREKKQKIACSVIVMDQSHTHIRTYTNEHAKHTRVQKNKHMHMQCGRWHRKTQATLLKATAWLGFAAWQARRGEKHWTAIPTRPLHWKAHQLCRVAGRQPGGPVTLRDGQLGGPPKAAVAVRKRVGELNKQKPASPSSSLSSLQLLQRSSPIHLGKHSGLVFCYQSYQPLLAKIPCPPRHLFSTRHDTV